MVEKILNNTTPYGKIRASHESSLHSSTLSAHGNDHKLRAGDHVTRRRKNRAHGKRRQIGADASSLNRPSCSTTTSIDRVFLQCIWVTNTNAR